MVGVLPVTWKYQRLADPSMFFVSACLGPVGRGPAAGVLAEAADIADGFAGQVVFGAAKVFKDRVQQSLEQHVIR